MIIPMFLTKLKSFLLFFINVFRRALCCFRRRRRLSGDVEPLSHIVVNESNTTGDLEQWNDWDFKNRKPSNIQEHIEYYRQQQSKLIKKQNNEMEEEEGDKDLFEDMAPKITRQKKVLIGSTTERTSNLDAQPSANFTSNELENWEDNSGWGEENLDWNAQELIRQKKREERERRLWEQQQKRMEKTTKPNVLGAKIGS